MFKADWDKILNKHVKLIT